MGFRIAMGSGRCAELSSNSNSRVHELCSRILGRVAHLQALPAESLLALPSEATTTERIEAQIVSFTTYNEPLHEHDRLLVVQGFLPSWRYPRYFGPAGIGFMVAEGLVLHRDGSRTAAPDDLLWPFR